MQKGLSFALALLMLHVSGLAPLANETPLEKARRALRASEVKAAVAAVGTGKRARVRVRLFDRTEYHGYVTEIADDHFVVADAKTGATAPIYYPEVKGIKGNNLSTGAKIGIGAAVATGVIIGLARGGRDRDEEVTSGCRPTVTTPCPDTCICAR